MALRNETTGNTFQFVELGVSLYFRLALFAVVILASLVGNIVVIRAVVRAKEVKTTTYFLVCNLALAEIVSSCCLPFLQTYSELATWPFPAFTCHLINPLQVAAGFVVTCSITAIAVNRWLLVMRKRFIVKSSVTVALCITLVLWISSFVFALPHFIFMVQVPSWNGDGKHWCLILFPGDAPRENGYPSSRLRTMIIVHLILNYLVPMASILVCYSMIIIKLRKQSQITVRRAVSFFDNAETQTEMGDVSSEAPGGYGAAINNEPFETKNSTQTQTQQVDSRATSAEELVDYETDLLKMFYAIVLIFVLCYLPYQCIYMSEYFGLVSWHNWRYFDVTRKYLYLLTCFPSALHPICYGVMSRFYHNAFSTLVLCK